MSDVVHICNFKTWEVEAGEWGVQGLPMLHGSSSQEEKKPKAEASFLSCQILPIVNELQCFRCLCFLEHLWVLNDL